MSERTYPQVPAENMNGRKEHQLLVASIYHRTPMHRQIISSASTPTMIRMMPELLAGAWAEAKPLAKAYLLGQLFRLVRNHPATDWGLQYCPRLADEIRAFHELEAKAPLLEAAWLLEKEPDAAKMWEAFFAARLQIERIIDVRLLGLFQPKLRSQTLELDLRMGIEKFDQFCA